MNVRQFVPSLSRRVLSTGFLMLAAGLQQPVHASGVDLSQFRRIVPPYIAALGDHDAISCNGATLYDVTQLGCRSARYTPATANNSCSPANVRTKGFPVNPEAAMPVVNGCRKQDYAVLIVVGLPVTH